jgi:hypothetical protein
LLGILRAVSVATFDLARLGCCHQRCFHFWWPAHHIHYIIYFKNNNE